MSEKELLSDILSLFTLRLPAAKAASRRTPSSILSLKHFQAAFRAEALSLQLRLGSPFLYEVISPVLDLFENVIDESIFRPDGVVDENVSKFLSSRNPICTAFTHLLFLKSPIAAAYPKLCQLQHLIRVQSKRNKKLVDLYHHIRFSEDKRQELLADLGDFNGQLESQSGVEIETFSMNDSVAARELPHFVRDRLMLLHKALNNHFSCKCGSNHGVSLRLSTHEHLGCNHKEEACLEVSFSSEVEGRSRWQEGKISIRLVGPQCITDLVCYRV